MIQASVARRRLIVLALLALALLGWSGPGVAQVDGDKLNVLIVDETKTFEASLFVNMAAGALKQTGMFNVEATFVDVDSSFDDPLGPNESGSVYDIIAIVPRALEKRELTQIWLATCPYLPGGPDRLQRGVETIQDLVAEQSRGVLTALGVHDDGVPGFFATIFSNNGWLSCD